MTKMIYDVLYRPKKNSEGRTDIGWEAECGREAVPVGGYLITNRTLPNEKRQYTAMVTKVNESGVQIDTMVGASFETRASAAFAIWRKYYEGWRAERADEKASNEYTREQQREARTKQREFRQTPEGQKAYREELNRKARERRASMTPEEIAMAAAKRRSKRFADKIASE